MEDLIQSLKEEDSDSENKGTDKENDMHPSQSDEGEADTIEDESVNGNESVISHQSENISNTSVNGNGYVNGNGKMMCENGITSKETAKEEAFLKICSRFPSYSEELLRSMLVNLTLLSIFIELMNMVILVCSL